MKNFLFVLVLAFAAFAPVAQAQTRLAGSNKPQPAAVDYFLKIDGIDGESADGPCRNCEIQIESFIWGATNPQASGVGTGGGAGKVSFSDLSFSMKNQKVSPKLLEASATGQHIKEAVLTCRKAGGNQQEYLTYKLKDVLVSSFSAASGGTRGDTAPIESFSLNFSKIEFQWTDSKGNVKKLGAGETPQSVHRKFVGN